MSRGLTAEQVAALSGDQLITGTLVEIILDGVTLLLTDVPGGVRHYPPNASVKEYIGGATLIAVADVEENTFLAAPQCAVTLSGLSPATIALGLAYKFQFREINISQVVLSDGSIVGAPILVFGGVCSTVTIVQDPVTNGTASITITATGLLDMLDKTYGRTTSHMSEQVHSPGDMGLEFAGQHGRELIWGSRLLIT